MATEKKMSPKRTVLVVLGLVALAALLSVLNLRVSQASVHSQVTPVALAAGGPASAGIVQITNGTDVSYPTAVTLAVDTEATLRAVWADGGDLHTSISSDSGATWSTAGSPQGDPWKGEADWEGARLRRAHDGSKTWMMAKSVYRIELLYGSEDDGESWTRAGLTIGKSGVPAGLWPSSDDSLWIVFWDWYQAAQSWRVRYIVSTDQGATWSSPANIATSDSDYRIESPSVVETADGAMLVVWNRNHTGLQSSATTDGGSTWSAQSEIPSSHGFQDPSLGIASDGALWLAARGGADEDIWTWYSMNEGVTWTGPSRFTYFSGPDLQADWTPLDGARMGLVWRSNRSGSYQAWFGVPGLREDTNPPPYVSSLDRKPYRDLTSETVVTFSANAEDETGLESVDLICSIDGLAQPPLPMFDDSTHGDRQAGDSEYTAQVDSFPADTDVSCQARAIDTDGNQYTKPDVEEFHVRAAPRKTWFAYW